MFLSCDLRFFDNKLVQHVRPVRYLLKVTNPAPCLDRIVFFWHGNAALCASICFCLSSDPVRHRLILLCTPDFRSRFVSRAIAHFISYSPSCHATLRIPIHARTAGGIGICFSWCVASLPLGKADKTCPSRIQPFARPD